MDGNKESRKSLNRRKSGRKEGKRHEIGKIKRNEESWRYSVTDVDVGGRRMAIVEQEMTPLDLENFDNETEKAKTTLMCPALRRQLQTHKNVLRLLHEYKLASTQINGQRILSIQPMRWSGPTPGIECEIFVGRIPKTIYEDTLYPLFKKVGEVFQIRLMVDMAELTRGYCFIMYTSPEDAACAIAKLDQYEISPGRKIRVLASINKCKLYIGPLPCRIASKEVVRVIYASAWDIEYVSIYRFANDDAAYAIVSFKSHRNAALARRKLRPERLFKCNEVHVEWARVDWNPSNVYEDRGTVDDKGDVQIIRRYLQSKKSTPTLMSTPNEPSARCKKQLSPICPPSGNGNGGASPSVKSARNCNGTRYSTMLTMSATLDDSPFRDKKLEMVTDVNDNVQLANEQCDINKDASRRKDDPDDANSFPNFNMWNSNLVPSLSDSPTNSSSLKDYESPDKASPNEWNDWEIGVKYPSPTAVPSNGYRYSSDSNLSSYQYHSYYERSSDKTIDRNQTIADDHVRFQSSARQSHAAAMSYYVLLQPQQSYLYPKEVVTYPQSAIVNHIRDCYGQTCASLSANNNRVSHWCNRQSDVHGSTDHRIIGVEKIRDCGKISLKAENSHALNYNQNYAPNFLLNLTPPIYGLNCTSDNAMSPYLVSYDVTSYDNGKRPRAILKQTINQL